MDGACNMPRPALMFVFSFGVSRKFTPFCTEDLGDIGYTGTWVIFLNRWAAVTGVKKESSGWAFGAGVGSFDFQVLGLDDVVLLLLDLPG